MNTNKIQFSLSRFKGSEEIREIKLAMSEFENYTCIRFRPKTDNDTYWLEITDGHGCSSNVGYERENTLILDKRCRQVKY